VCLSGGQSQELPFCGTPTLDQVVFPLCVLTWLEAYDAAQIDLEAFLNSPMVFFANAGIFSACWQRYDGMLWSLSARLGTGDV
jgi:hypothetical protein